MLVFAIEVNRTLGDRGCARDVRYLGAIESGLSKNPLGRVKNARLFGFNAALEVWRGVAGIG